MPLVSQDHVLVKLLRLLVLSLYFDLEPVVPHLCMMSQTASTTGVCVAKEMVVEQDSKVEGTVG